MIIYRLYNRLSFDKLILDMLNGEKILIDISMSIVSIRYHICIACNREICVHDRYVILKHNRKRCVCAGHLMNYDYHISCYTNMLYDIDGIKYHGNPRPYLIK
jgi:hypothetical protein